MLVPYIVHISYLLRERWRHGVGHHRRWGWWLLVLWWWGLRVERKRRMIHAVLSSPLHAAKLRWGLETMVPEATLVWWTTEITLSVAVVVIVIAKASIRVATISPINVAVLGLAATKGGLRPSAKTSITVPVSIAATTKITSPTPRIPIPTVVLVASSSPSTTTCSR